MQIKELKNIFEGILSFLIVFGAVKLGGLTVETGHWIIILLLILIYFEVMDLNDRR